MNGVFTDSSIVIHYIQQMLNETYNSDIIVNGEYYTTFDMNYGLAHYIAKYLKDTFPILDLGTKQAYEQNSTNTMRDITLPISIYNYFLCSNDEKRLNFEPTEDPDEYEESMQNDLYRQVYNKYSVVYFDQETQTYKTPYKKYINNDDLPIFTSITDGAYSVNTNEIFTLSGWGVKKGIFELDDLVTSFLLGRTIGPNSSMEDIYYAQKLLIQNRVIDDKEKGIWCLPNQEGTIYDMTQTVINYQKNRVSKDNTTPLFVTGYFDIYTEGYVLKEIGGDINGILGL